MLRFQLKGAAHGAVQCGDAVVGMYMAVQYGNVAEAAYPFWFCKEAGEVERVYDTAHAVAPAAHEYSLYLCIIEHGLQVGKALCICAREIKMFCAHCFTQLHSNTPALQHYYRMRYPVFGYIARRAGDADYRTLL